MQNKKVMGLVLVGVLALGAQMFPQQFAALRGLLDGAPNAQTPEQASASTQRGVEKGSTAYTNDYGRLYEAIEDQQFEVWLDELEFEVVKLLRDDLEGSRHQRFLVTAPGVDTILIAHNIDLAERVPLSEGDDVRIRGRFEWNNKGGVIHWTHHDPKGRREGGWIEYRGEVYK